MRPNPPPSFMPACAQRGAITVELALVTVLLLLIVAGSIGFGRTFWYADALTKATRDGARMMSSWPVADINSAGVAAARNVVVNMANAAGISPQLTAANVEAECLDAAFSSVACVDGTPPLNVRVRITGFTVTIGEWFPFIDWSGPLNFGGIGLSPHTAMRYLL